MACYTLKNHYGTSRGPTKDGLKVGHLNTCSMVKKMIDIKNVVKKMHDFDIFTISETWLSDTNTKTRNKKAELKIEGYEKIERADRPLEKKETGGGVAVYVRSGIIYARITDNNLNDEIMQHIHIVVKSDRSGKPIPYIHISAVYIAPESESECKQRLLRILDYHKVHSNVIVLGDVNINQFKKLDEHTSAITQRGFCQLINEITRPKSGTLLDHIYVRRSQVENMIAESGVTQCRISDHDLVFCTVSADFMKRDFSTPMKMYKTIITGSGHMKAADQLCTLCKAIVCQIAKQKNQLDVSALPKCDSILTPFDHGFITNKYSEWFKLFWEQFNGVYLEHADKKIFFIRKSFDWFPWLAIGVDIGGQLSRDDTELSAVSNQIVSYHELAEGKLVFLHYRKWSAKVSHKELADELIAHGERSGCAALAVFYRVDATISSSDQKKWYAYVVFGLSRLEWRYPIKLWDYPLLWDAGLVGCKIPKLEPTTELFKTILDKVIGYLKGIPVVTITGWKPYGKPYVLSNNSSSKVHRREVESHIEQMHEVQSLPDTR